MILPLFVLSTNFFKTRRGAVASSFFVEFYNVKCHLELTKIEILASYYCLRSKMLLTIHIISPKNIPQACKNGCMNGLCLPSVLSDVIVSAHLNFVMQILMFAILTRTKPYKVSLFNLDLKKDRNLLDR